MKNEEVKMYNFSTLVRVEEQCNMYVNVVVCDKCHISDLLTDLKQEDQDLYDYLNVIFYHMNTFEELEICIYLGPIKIEINKTIKVMDIKVFKHYEDYPNKLLMERKIDDDYRVKYVMDITQFLHVIGIVDYVDWLEEMIDLIDVNDMRETSK
jgi:hypothetical protein